MNSVAGQFWVDLDWVGESDVAVEERPRQILEGRCCVRRVIPNRNEQMNVMHPPPHDLPWPHPGENPRYRVREQENRQANHDPRQYPFLDLFHKDSRSDLWAAICENAGAGGSHRSAGRLVERKLFIIHTRLDRRLRQNVRVS